MWDKWITDEYIEDFKKLNIDTKKFIDKLENDIYKACGVSEELLHNEHTNTNNINAKFELKEFEKAMKTIKELPPIAIKLEVYPQGLNALKNTMTDNEKLDKELDSMDLCSDVSGYKYQYKGINIIVVYDNENFKCNQGRFIFNDGSTKIIDLI